MFAIVFNPSRFAELVLSLQVVMSTPHDCISPSSLMASFGETGVWTAWKGPLWIRCKWQKTVLLIYSMESSPFPVNIYQAATLHLKRTQKPETNTITQQLFIKSLPQWDQFVLWNSHKVSELISLCMACTAVRRNEKTLDRVTPWSWCGAEDIVAVW